MCGDGFVVGLESCDDGSYDHIGCDDICTGIIQGYACVHHQPNQSVCTTICGDGLVLGSETCDDGTLNNEGCNSTCNGYLSGWGCNGGSET